jgi:tetratricopeptide (TPR) repeat protein
VRLTAVHYGLILGRTICQRALGLAALGITLWVTLLPAQGALTPRPPSATSEERTMTNAFSSALKRFEDGLYPDAENRFEGFATSYTNSPLMPLAILYQARSRYCQSNYSGAISLLHDHLPKAGAQADYYEYWIGESQLASGNGTAAIDVYSNLMVSFPKSSLRLAAALGQARAYEKLNAWANVIELLNADNGVFQTSARTNLQSDTAVRGFILLGQAFLNEGKLPEAEKTLVAVQAADLPPELDWRRTYWLCRVKLAQNHAPEALAICTNRLAFLCAGRWRDTVETYSLQGEIFERLDRLQEATDAYTNNLASDLPADVQRNTLFKTVSLMLRQNQADEAMRRLEVFIDKVAADPALDVARVTLGELQLKAFYSAQETNATNLILSAQNNFSQVINDFPNSGLRGKAYLDRGWCAWAQNKIAEAQADFLAAMPHLSVEDQAVARFKLADTLFAQKQYAAAITNYSVIIRQSETNVLLRNGLLTNAFYQLLRASIKDNNAASANSALANIVEKYRDDFTPEGSLLYGEFQNSHALAAQARETLSAAAKKFPDSPFRPQTDFAIAQSYTRESDWASATAQYDLWVKNYSNQISANPSVRALLPKAEFSRALTRAKGGDDTNALALMTNFVVRFADHPLAVWAQNWVADYWFNRGEYVDAEKCYLDLAALAKKNHDTNDLGYRAYFMAGRSAVSRQGRGVDEARKYFLYLVDDLATNSKAPPSLLAESYFALGDTLAQQYHDSTNTLDVLRQAVAAFSRVTNIAASASIAPLAMGRIADCHFEWARQTGDQSEYALAVDCYQAVLNNPLSGISARSRAEVCLGMIAEKQGLPSKALDHYWRVLYDLDPGNFDPVWVNEAGVNAAQICEKQEQWDKAIKVYQRVLEANPSLKPALDKYIAQARAHLGSTKK